MTQMDLSKVRGKAISLGSQEPALSRNPVMRVGEQIAEVVRAHVATSRTARRRHVEDLLGSVGFDSPRQVYSAYPHQLRGGQRQRVGIAQTIACHPVIVIANEPTSTLNAALQVVNM